MKKLNFWQTVAVVAMLILVLALSVKSNSSLNNDFSIQGIIDYCEEDCYDSISVKNVSIGTEFESSSGTDYGGAISPRYCISYAVMGGDCGELDVTKLADYYIASTTNPMAVTSSFGNYSYIGQYAISKYQKKIYFLYKIWKPDIKWVYESPLKIVSYDPQTKLVNDEGTIGVTNISVQDMRVSPRGTYILIVDGYNPRYISTITTAGISAFNIKDKTTQSITSVGNGDGMEFVSWIDDTHFFYAISKYAQAGKVTFKMGAIK